jgi:hypothetical protein
MIRYSLDTINRERRRRGMHPLTRMQAESAARDASPGTDLALVLLGAAVASSAFSTASEASTPSFVAGGGDFAGGGSSGDTGGGGAPTE